MQIEIYRKINTLTDAAFMNSPAYQIYWLWRALVILSWEIWLLASFLSRPRHFIFWTYNKRSEKNLKNAWSKRLSCSLTNTIQLGILAPNNAWNRIYSIPLQSFQTTKKKCLKCYPSLTTKYPTTVGNLFMHSLRINSTVFVVTLSQKISGSRLVDIFF